MGYLSSIFAITGVMSGATSDIGKGPVAVWLADTVKLRERPFDETIEFAVEEFFAGDGRWDLGPAIFRVTEDLLEKTVQSAAVGIPKELTRSWTNLLTFVTEACGEEFIFFADPLHTNQDSFRTLAESENGRNFCSWLKDLVDSRANRFHAAAQDGFSEAQENIAEAEEKMAESLRGLAEAIKPFL